MSRLLPEDFGGLEEFAPHWSGASAGVRAHLRDSATPETALAFYKAVQPELASALTFLDRKPLAEHDDRERQLMRLLLSYAHVAMAIEVQGNDEPAHSQLRPYMRLTRAPADAQ
jgi:hypothetical protein